MSLRRTTADIVGEGADGEMTPLVHIAVDHPEVFVQPLLLNSYARARVAATAAFALTLGSAFRRSCGRVRREQRRHDFVRDVRSYLGQVRGEREARTYLGIKDVATIFSADVVSARNQALVR